MTKFELDLDDGEVRFQIAQILIGESVGEEVIDRMISTTLNMLDMYLPAFLSVIYANELPKDAIGRVEAAFRPPNETSGEDGAAGE